MISLYIYINWKETVQFARKMNSLFSDAELGLGVEYKMPSDIHNLSQVFTIEWFWVRSWPIPISARSCLLEKFFCLTRSGEWSHEEHSVSRVLFSTSRAGYSTIMSIITTNDLMFWLSSGTSTISCPGGRTSCTILQSFTKSIDKLLWEGQSIVSRVTVTGTTIDIVQNICTWM